MFKFRSVLLSLLATALVAGCASMYNGESSTAARQELAPTGKVRVALSVGPSSNQFRAKLDRATNRPQGVAVAGRETLTGLLTKLPGARVLDDTLYALPVSVAVPKGRPAALAYVADFIESAKATGVVRRAFDNAGFKNAAVAPAASGR